MIKTVHIPATFIRKNIVEFALPPKVFAFFLKITNTRQIPILPTKNLYQTAMRAARL